MLNPIPIDRWGRDHWSTLAYIETCAVDQGGEPDARRMRTDPALHPHMGPVEYVGMARQVDGAPYPTRLLDGVTVGPHDDWSCLDDAEAAGLAENTGTGTHRRYLLTPQGLRIAAQLRAHKARGGSYATFRLDTDAAPQPTPSQP